MGSDYYADEDGCFKMIFRPRGTTEARQVSYYDLEPGEQIDTDLLVGEER
jgi:hypothetical protein